MITNGNLNPERASSFTPDPHAWATLCCRKGELHAGVGKWLPLGGLWFIGWQATRSRACITWDRKRGKEVGLAKMRLCGLWRSGMIAQCGGPCCRSALGGAVLDLDDQKYSIP